MFDIIADIFRALITGAVFFYLRAMRGKEPPRLRKAWIFFLIGFGLLFLAGLLNVADNFPSLSKYIKWGISLAPVAPICCGSGGQGRECP